MRYSFRLEPKENLLPELKDLSIVVPYLQSIAHIDKEQPKKLWLIGARHFANLLGLEEKLLRWKEKVFSIENFDMRLSITYDMQEIILNISMLNTHNRYTVTLAKQWENKYNIERTIEYYQKRMQDHEKSIEMYDEFKEKITERNNYLENLPSALKNIFYN